jgi:hypothetical protein
MVVARERFLLFDSPQLWYPSSPEAVLPFLAQAPVVTVMQCEDAVAESLARYAFRRRRFDTMLMDLSLSEEELWARLDGTCRRQIRKARRMDCSVSVNPGPEEREGAFRLVNQHISQRQFRRPMSPAEWARLLECRDLFVVRLAGRLVAARVVLVDPPLRARFLVSATIDRKEEPDRHLTGPLNRYLHWFEFNYYKGQGVRYYDLAGVILDRASPLYSISRFKLSFGGQVIKENVIRLAANPALRLLLKGAATTRRGWRTTLYD